MSCPGTATPGELALLLESVSQGANVQSLGPERHGPSASQPLPHKGALQWGGVGLTPSAAVLLSASSGPAACGR